MTNADMKNMNIVNSVSIFSDNIAMNSIFSEEYGDEEYFMWRVPGV